MELELLKQILSGQALMFDELKEIKQDIAGIKERLDRLEERMDRLETRTDKLEREHTDTMILLQEILGEIKKINFGQSQTNSTFQKMRTALDDYVSA